MPLSEPLSHLDAYEPLPPSGDEIHENRLNGYGYWSFTPAPSASVSEALPHLGTYGTQGAFMETPYILGVAERARSVLLCGAPGSGKSHFIRDLQAASLFNSLPTFLLSMHINAGHRDGPERIAQPLEEFLDRSEETGGLVILDNVDFVGYKGRSKQRSLVAAYAQKILPVVTDLIEDKDLVVIGTAHDDAWREGRWTWSDPAIDGPAHAILEAFPARVEFEGKMGLVGLARILQAREEARREGESHIGLSEAAQVMQDLEKMGRANFFHARHVDVALFLRDPEQAIARIEAGRNERRGIRA